MGLLDQALGLAAGFQVVAVATAGIERAHVDQAPDPGRLAGDDQLFDQLDMGAPEALAAKAALVEDANQVDGQVVPVQGITQGLEIVGIELADADAGHDGEVAGGGRVARGDGDLMSGAARRRTRCPPTKPEPPVIRIFMGDSGPSGPVNGRLGNSNLLSCNETPSGPLTSRGCGWPAPGWTLHQPFVDGGESQYTRHVVAGFEERQGFQPHIRGRLQGARVAPALDRIGAGVVGRGHVDPLALVARSSSARWATPSGILIAGSIRPAWPL
jgi:hypothetical protein